jgi:putative ABC transport system permease protein
MFGIYGVTAYAVQQRNKEIAIRVALGASERAVVRMFVRDGALLLGVGTAMGLVGGAALSRILRSQVFGVESFDVSTYTVAATLLIGAGLTAVFWAARRAATAHPVSVLNAGQ